jgi:Protein of unknown function (DUF1257)
MSHITKVKSKIDNLLLLKKTLADLDIECIEATTDNSIKLKAWGKEKINEDVIMEIKTGSSYSVGLVLNKEDNTYEFVADWWSVETFTGIKQEDFIDKITQKYAYNNIMDKIKDKGYELVTEKVDEDKNIRLVLRKWQ